MQDPDGHSVQFIQYLPGSIHSQNFGKHISHKRLSDHILHVGIRVIDPARADKFYKDILGFRLMWKGGRTDSHFDWISMLVPDGPDWVEYMVTEQTPTPQQLGVLHHYCLGTLDIQDTIQNSGRARLSTAETPEYRSRRPLAAAAVRQKLHENRTDGTEAGGNSVLLTHD